MAGITGIQGADKGDLERIFEKIKHRGPDETWINREQEVNIVCCELNVGGNAKTSAHHSTDG